MNKNVLLKYLNSDCTSEELEEVEKWILASKENTTVFNQMKTDFILDTFEKTANAASTEKSFDDFQTKYRHNNVSFARKYASKLAYAAVFAIVLTSGCFVYFNDWNDTLFSIPENAITLELEDGSIRVIEEDGSSRVLDTSGKLVGQQQGSQLIYSKQGDSGAKEIVFNTLTVPYGKKFNLLLSDGTNVYLNSGSSIKYPVQFLEGIIDRQVYITGEAYLDVAKNREHPFIVIANDLNVRVLGTQFNVSAYPEDETTDVVLVEGSVSLYAQEEYGTNNTLLEPGFKGSFDREQNSVATEKVITSIYTSWMKDELVFRNMTFTNILKKLERHYDVVIVNNNQSLSQKAFNANFGNEPIAKVLEELKLNYGIGYRIDQNGKIIIE